MGPEALALVLTAAVAHALWNLAAKTVPDAGATFVQVYFLASAAIWAPVATAWMWWQGVWPQVDWLVPIAVTGVLHVVYSVTLQVGYDRGDLSLVYPLARGTGPLVTVVVAVLVLGERPGLAALAGAVVVVAGVLVIAVGRPDATVSRERRRAGLVFGVATGLSIAAYTLWDDYSVTGPQVPPVPYFSFGLLVQCLLLGLWLAPRARRGPVSAGEVWSRHRAQVLVVAVLSPLAYVLVLQAMRTTPVALVAPARESSIVVGSLLGWLVLKEPDPARRLVGAVVVLAGIALLAAG